MHSLKLDNVVLLYSDNIINGYSIHSWKLHQQRRTTIYGEPINFICIHTQTFFYLPASFYRCLVYRKTPKTDLPDLNVLPILSPMQKFVVSPRQCFWAHSMNFNKIFCSVVTAKLNLCWMDDWKWNFCQDSEINTYFNNSIHIHM